MQEMYFVNVNLAVLKELLDKVRKWKCLPIAAPF